MRLFMIEILSGDLEKPGKRGGRSVVTLVYNRLHEAFWQGFSVSKIYYSYRSENKNDGKNPAANAKKGAARNGSQQKVIPQGLARITTGGRRSSRS
ncbi:hypothetical protein [Shinella zoogloeoides]|uniref:hypothetical protein n=1 Tax=Shinella zoogloeoides TaxID=352475 RepID=UPI0013C2B8FE|nr:hypothetical protein [Shinella zoogloeoides]